MQTVFDFFIDPLIWPFHLYIAGYGLVWLVAFLLSRLFMPKIGIEIGVMRGWKMAFTLHFLAGTALVFWLCFKAIDLVKAWWHIIFYMLPYIAIFLLDVYFLLLSNENSKGISSSRPRRRRNPRKA